MPELQAVLAAFDEYGFAEHFMTDYDDDQSYRDPWSLFHEADAQKALATVNTGLALAERMLNFYHPASNSSRDEQPQ